MPPRKRFNTAVLAFRFLAACFKCATDEVEQCYIFLFHLSSVLSVRAALTGPTVFKCGVTISGQLFIAAQLCILLTLVEQH